MVKKFKLSIISRQDTLHRNLNIFDINFLVKAGIFSQMRYDCPIKQFNNAGYLEKLLLNFKGSIDSCYLLFHALVDTSEFLSHGHGVTQEALKEITSLTGHYTVIKSEAPKVERLPIVQTRLGEEIAFCEVSREQLPDIQKVFNNILSAQTWCYFIFGSSDSRDKLISVIKNINGNNFYEAILNSSLSSEMIFINLDYECQGDEFKILSQRYDVEQLCSLLMEIDPKNIIGERVWK